MKLGSIFQRSLGIKRKDNVLIITDNKKMKIAKKFKRALKGIADNISIVKIKVDKINTYDAMKPIMKIMLESDVIIAVTTHSITHSDARIAASKKGARIASMPGFTESMMKALQADPYEMLRVSKRIERVLRKTDMVRVMTPSGTYISFSIKNRKIEEGSGIIKTKGAYDNLPGGEISLSPVEGTANGLMVINSMGTYAKNGTLVHVKDGRAFDISDKKCLLAKIFNTVKSSANIAEFAIGLNKKAKIIGNILQDEKVYGTCHIAFGNNKSYGGKVFSKVHMDAILFKPTIWFDEKMIMKKGKLLL